MGVFMQRFKSILMLILTILVVLACALLVVENPTSVNLAFAGMQSPDLSLGLLVIIVFGCGALSTVMVNILWYSSVLLHQRRLNKALQLSLKRVEHIRPS